MATATVSTETKTVETEVSEKVVKLEMSPKEASVLKTLLGRVSGNGMTTNRKHTQSISNALFRAGIAGDDCCHFLSGSITAGVA